MSKLPSDLAQQVATALAEDIGSGDITAELVPAAQRVTGKVITREDATLCGRPWVVEVFRQLDPSVQLKWHADDGDRVTANQTLFEIAGLARPVLTGERSAINFLQLLSATATATRGYVDAIAGTSAAILDTRKTVPGLRTAQKYAVLCGGGQNYRLGLFDQVLIKENHIAAAGSLTAAIEAARRAAGSRKVDVEVETPQEFAEALRAAPDIIMLDEFSLDDMRAAVALNNEKGHRVTLEASGSVTLETVRKIAETGIDYISIGGITKHIRAVDLSMRLAFDSFAHPSRLFSAASPHPKRSPVPDAGHSDIRSANKRPLNPLKQQPTSTPAEAAPPHTQVWGVAPQLGRDFNPAEERYGGPNAVLISDGYWRRRFGASPDVTLAICRPLPTSTVPTSLTASVKAAIHAFLNRCHKPYRGGL